MPVEGTGSPGQVAFWTADTAVSSDPRFVFNPATRHLGLNSGANPVAVLQALFDTGSALFNVGRQAGHGADARVLGIADGSPAVPVATTSPTAVMQRVDATDFEGAYIPFQFTVDKRSGGGWLYALHSHAGSQSPGVHDIVAVSGSVEVNPTSAPTVTQTGFAFWGRAVRNRTGTRICSAQFDVFNGDDPANPMPDASDPQGTTPGAEQDYTIGVQIAGDGAGRNSAALWIAGTPTGKWKTGVFFDPDSVASYGIDFKFLGTAATPIRLGNNTFVRARNHADTADLTVLGVAGDDTVRVGDGDILIGGNLLLSPGAPFGSKNVGIGSVGPPPDAKLEVNGGANKGLRIVPRAAPGAPAGGSWSIGTLVVDATGVLYIFTAAGWRKVGSQ
jgi:hypothetical protein